jgi:hypothetical protein
MVFNAVSANNDPNLPVWPRERYPVTIALSEDEGKAWPYMRNIERVITFAGRKISILIEGMSILGSISRKMVFFILCFPTEIVRQSNM